MRNVGYPQAMSDPHLPQYQPHEPQPPAAQPIYQQHPQQYQQPQYVQPQYIQMVKPPSNGMATASMVLGIITCVCLFTIIGWPLVPILGLLAIIFGFIGLSKADSLNGLGKGNAVGGLIMGFTPIIIAVGGWIIGSIFG